MDYGHQMTPAEKARVEDACIDTMERYRPLPGQDMTKQYQRVLRTILHQEVREDGWDQLMYTGPKVFRINETTGELRELNFVRRNRDYTYDRPTVKALLPTYEKRAVDELQESLQYMKRLRWIKLLFSFFIFFLLF